ncbi:MAG: type II secretion system F family protein [Devosiaceae bacterium]|nr:type II secretion system F family protein [Devosiaceae bacterium]
MAMNILNMLVDPSFLIAMFAAISAAAAVFTFGSQFFDRSELKGRIKRVAVEREQMRAQEMQRLRGRGQKSSDIASLRGVQSGTMVKRTVESLSLRKAFLDDKTTLKLAQAGYRSSSNLTTYLFMRFASPIVLFIGSFIYLGFIIMPDRPMYLILLYALTIGLAGSYLPAILLKNKIIKRKQSIKKAWPDTLDLMLLCVESGMSIEHAIQRVAREIGEQSPELAEELTLTKAELSFLEIRAKAYENLAGRTDLDSVRSVATALIQADKYGTSVGQALRVMAEEGREERMMAAEKKAAALPPKMTVPLIVFFLPVLFIVIISPAIIKVMENGGIGF